MMKFLVKTFWLLNRLSLTLAVSFLQCRKKMNFHNNGKEKHCGKSFLKYFNFNIWNTSRGWIKFHCNKSTGMETQISYASFVSQELIWTWIKILKKETFQNWISPAKNQPRGLFCFFCVQNNVELDLCCEKKACSRQHKTHYMQKQYVKKYDTRVYSSSLHSKNLWKKFVSAFTEKTKHKNASFDFKFVKANICRCVTEKGVYFSRFVFLSIIKSRGKC